MKIRPYLSIAVAAVVGGLSAHAAPLLIDFSSTRTAEQGNGSALAYDFIQAGLPEAEADGAVRSRERDAHGPQHVRGFQGAGGARRSRRAAEVDG